jgi:hypothetical protein
VSDENDGRGAQGDGVRPLDHAPAPRPVTPVPAMDDRPIPGEAPTTLDDRWWTDVDRRHRSLTIAGVIAGVIVLAIGIGVAVAVIGSRMSSRGSGSSQQAIQPIPVPSGTVETTIPLPAETTGTTATSGTPAPLPVGGRGRYVAYRKDGAVWVATESGEDPKRIFSSLAGPYALSPDAKTLAVVDSSSQTFALVDVATGQAAVVGKAVPDRPSWAPDSSFVVYTSQPIGSHDTEIDRVDRNGSGRKRVGLGSGARVGPDGVIAAISASRTAEGTPLEIFSAGSSKRIGLNLSPYALAPLKGSIVFADAGGLIVSGTLRAPSVRVIANDGAGLKTLVAKPSVGVGVSFGDIVSSPDLTRIVYAETGDDGYSRLFCMKASGGTPKALSLRRDDYIVGWSADGTEILFIEGNAIQEEPTKLMAMRSDGTRRRTVIEGAGQ